jgi:hypothetical protein
MDERDTVAVVLLLVFICWLLAIIIGMKVVNSWVYSPPFLWYLLCSKADALFSFRPKRCMIPDGLTVDSERKSLIRVLRADARAAEDAERAERAEAVTATVTAAESEVD